MCFVLTLSSQELDFVRLATQFEPAQRPEAALLLQHAWVVAADASTRTGTHGEGNGESRSSPVEELSLPEARERLLSEALAKLGL